MCEHPEGEFNGAPRLPEDARLLGYNRDVGFFLSESAGLVYVVQGGLVWAFPRLAGPPGEEREI